MLPSTGTVGDSYDNTLSERTNNTYKRELTWINRPYRTVDELEYTTMRWVASYNSKLL
ncbi:integrase core domain-containing protein [Bifidobacterium callitrichos]|nr:integrase core domain-containing protein [Bifidobacterium callitrichos]